MFPREVVENILKFCDGKTLVAARHVSKTWRAAVKYVSKVSLYTNFLLSKDLYKFYRIVMSGITALYMIFLLMNKFNTWRIGYTSLVT